mmetsp:Transcript_13724/g.31772  ORF Transcript_13724/g.31772 Transcript_13724/m.31772 type:complete len:308 (+) Transcript_13724:231-1154(+)
MGPRAALSPCHGVARWRRVAVERRDGGEEQAPQGGEDGALHLDLPGQVEPQWRPARDCGPGRLCRRMEARRKGEARVHLQTPQGPQRRHARRLPHAGHALPCRPRRGGGAQLLLCRGGRHCVPCGRRPLSLQGGAEDGGSGRRAERDGRADVPRGEGHPDRNQRPLDHDARAGPRRRGAHQRAGDCQAVCKGRGQDVGPVGRPGAPGDELVGEAGALLEPGRRRELRAGHRGPQGPPRRQNHCHLLLGAAEGAVRGYQQRLRRLLVLRRGGPGGAQRGAELAAAAARDRQTGRVHQRRQVGAQPGVA